jgi:hypothetical protein
VWVGYLPAQGGTAHMVRLTASTARSRRRSHQQLGGLATPTAPTARRSTRSFNVWFTGLRGELFRINTDEEPDDLRPLEPAGLRPVLRHDRRPRRRPVDGRLLAARSRPTTRRTSSPRSPAPTPATAASRPTTTAACGSPRTAPAASSRSTHKTNTLIKFHNTLQSPASARRRSASASTHRGLRVAGRRGAAGRGRSTRPTAPGRSAAGSMKKVDIVGDHYTYSDMTGGQLKSVIAEAAAVRRSARRSFSCFLRA